MEKREKQLVKDGKLNNEKIDDLVERGVTQSLDQKASKLSKKDKALNHGIVE